MRNYTETLTFKNEVNTLRKNGILEEDIKKYTELNSQFDENGMEVETDYTNTILAFKHPIL